MSKIKSPQEKKKLSLERDRRNIYGENPTSSRKNINRGKQRSHMEQRRSVGEALRQARGSSDLFDADTIESQARTRTIHLKHHSFKKIPDAPLGVVIGRKLARRAKKGKNTV